MTHFFGKSPINTFNGDYRFLSNFYPAEVLFEGITWPSVEHAFQAAKTDDPAEKARILTAPRRSNLMRRITSPTEGCPR